MSKPVMVKGFVVFTRAFDSSRRHYLSRSENKPDTWTPELSEATILPHEVAFGIARGYRRAGLRTRMDVSVGHHGTIKASE